MSRKPNHTITLTRPAPMAASVAERRGALRAVDRHKKAERRRVRRQETLAWRIEHNLVATNQLA